MPCKIQLRVSMRFRPFVRSLLYDIESILRDEKSNSIISRDENVITGLFSRPLLFAGHKKKKEKKRKEKNTRVHFRGWTFLSFHVVAVFKHIAYIDANSSFVSTPERVPRILFRDPRKKKRIGR